jgi:glycosyltransferase involved in cell wall biosynthesis
VGGVSAPHISVAICVITLRRPVYLEKLLSDLSRLRFAHCKPDIRVVVVENESGGPGREVCERIRADFPFLLEYCEEPRKGIPYARNTAVELAGNVDFIAFIDDDEFPHENWLDELLRAQAQYDCDLVGGPVLPVYETPPPQWILDGKFHERYRATTGTSRAPNGTNNVLIRKSALDGLGAPFDVQFAMTGGSDTDLFDRMLKAGRTSVWCDEAIVMETVPRSRATVRWILQRTFRTAAMFAGTFREGDHGPRTPAYFFFRGIWLIMLGFMTMVVNIFRGPGAAIRSLRRIARGTGYIAGVFGIRYREYRVIHGK